MSAGSATSPTPTAQAPVPTMPLAVAARSRWRWNHPLALGLLLGSGMVALFGVMTRDPVGVIPFDKFRTGDLIFARIAQSYQQRVQSALTGNDIAHVGLMFVDRGGAWHVIEARGGAVKLTRIEEWVKQVDEGRFCLKRYDPTRDTERPEHLTAMEQWGTLSARPATEAAMRFIGLGFDWDYAWSTDWAMYNSELVAKAYERGLGVRLPSRPARTLYDWGMTQLPQDLRPPSHSMSLAEKAVFVDDLWRSTKLRTVWCTL